MRNGFLLLIVPALACVAAPHIDPGSVTFVQDAASRVVTTTYRLVGHRDDGRGDERRRRRVD